MNLEELRRSYHEKIAEAKKIFTTAETEKRSATKEENEKANTLMAEVENLKTEIRTKEKLQKAEEDEARNIDKTKEPAQAKSPDFRGLGEFLDCVKRTKTDHIIDNRLKGEARSTGLNESVSSDGGFLVPQEYAKELLKDSYDSSLVASKAKKTPVKGNNMSFRTIDESSRVDGSRYGGIQLYWLNEGGAATASQPKFGLLTMDLKKIVGLYYATEEILTDAVALESEVKGMFSEEFGFKIDDAVINGSGVGMPLGIMNAPNLVSVSKESGQTAKTLMYENVVKMWARMLAKYRNNAVWFINQDLEPQLHTMALTVGVGGAPVYMPPSGASGAPYSTLFGRPIIPIEQCQTVGTKGDIILADFSQYKMIEKATIKTASSIHVKFAEDETAFRFTYRCDGKPRHKAALTPAHGTNTLSPFVVLNDRS